MRDAERPPREWPPHPEPIGVDQHVYRGRIGELAHELAEQHKGGACLSDRHERGAGRRRPPLSLGMVSALPCKLRTWPSRSSACATSAAACALASRSGGVPPRGSAPPCASGARFVKYSAVTVVAASPETRVLSIASRSSWRHTLQVRGISRRSAGESGSN